MITTAAECLYYTHLWVKLSAYWIENKLDENSSNAAIGKAAMSLGVNWIGFDVKASAAKDLVLSSSGSFIEVTLSQFRISMFINLPVDAQTYYFRFVIKIIQASMVY